MIVLSKNLVLSQNLRENLHVTLGLALWYPCPHLTRWPPWSYWEEEGGPGATKGRTHQESPLPLRAGIPGLTVLQTGGKGN